jgi:hypothetical protein
MYFTVNMSQEQTQIASGSVKHSGRNAKKVARDFPSTKSIVEGNAKCVPQGVMWCVCFHHHISSVKKFHVVHRATQHNNRTVSSNSNISHGD